MYSAHTGGYLIKEGRALLVHHKGFDKWTPPGGRLEDKETPDKCLLREFKEETGLEIEIISAQPQVFAGDKNSLALPAPFYMDVEHDSENFYVGHYYYVRQLPESKQLQYQESESKGIGWFSKEEIEKLKTFEQVRALAKFAIDNYPKD